MPGMLRCDLGGPSVHCGRAPPRATRPVPTSTCARSADPFKGAGAQVAQTVPLPQQPVGAAARSPPRSIEWSRWWFAGRGHPQFSHRPTGLRRRMSPETPRAHRYVPSLEPPAISIRRVRAAYNAHDSVAHVRSCVTTSSPNSSVLNSEMRSPASGLGEARDASKPAKLEEPWGG